MKTKIVISLAALLFSMYVSAQHVWTLQQCVDTAWANNRNVKQQELTRKIRKINYEQARLNLLPNLNASANQSWSFGRSLNVSNTYQNTNAAQTSFGISSGITLFDGLKMKYNIDAQKANLLASDADLQKMKMDIATNVTAGFLQIVLNKELLQIAVDQVKLTTSKIKQQKELVAAGKLAEGEILNLVAQQAKEEMNRTNAENTLKLSLLDLAQYLELDHFEDLDVAIPDNIIDSELSLLSPDAIFNSAITHRPEIKSAEYKLENSELSVKTTEADYYPSLSLGAQYGTGYYKLSNVPNNSFSKQLNDNMSAGLSLNLQVPIFNKFDVRNRVRSAIIGIKSSQLNLDNAKLELKKTIQQSYYNAISAKSRWEAATKSEAANREAFRFANEKYEAGRATVYELYQAKSNLTQALSEEAQAKYEYFYRVKLLEYLK